MNPTLATIVVALIVSIAPTLTAGGALWVSLRNAKGIKKVDDKAGSIETKVDGGHTELLNALLKITASASFVAGQQSEKDKAKDLH